MLEAHFTVSGNKMTITNKILTNQRRPSLQIRTSAFQQKLDKIDMSKEKKGGA